ncbi:MAG: hypothetical protein HYS17_04230 [Micavibrio aeruginosavorus]|uniref:Lipoprotein n=1 Tax=Micavibrio aeruginosavorus TaxID=349221 RepID=A0A7T5R3Q8_9BACT|nr:MAG: hypothetical protein HYS17_04230 [Micavibrio aeruginosavorus]
MGVAVLMLAAAAMPVQAQMCDTLPEVISTLKTPTYGFPTVWDADYGERGRLIQFAAGVVMPEGTIMAYGVKIDLQTSQALQTGLVELNRRGRTLVEQFVPAKDGEQPAGMAKLGERFVGVSNIRVGKGKDRHVRLSWYDRQGVYKREQILSDAAYDYIAQGIVPAAEGKGFVVIVQAVNRKDPKDQYGILSRHTDDGKLVWKRAYRPGVNNMLAGLAVTDDKSYIATGKIIMDDGRMAGWILKLGHDGTILWQRTYPRGKYSVLNGGAASSRVTPDGGHYYLVTGAAEPVDDNPHAAWVMEVDPAGEPVWQRYYRLKDYEFNGQDISARADGRVVVVANALTRDSYDPFMHDHIRVLSLSPRGAMLDDQSYLNGLKAQASDVTRNASGETVITATILKEQKKSEQEYGPEKPVPEGQQPAPEPPLQEGWVMVVPGLDVYEDPCVRKPRR